MLPTSHSALTTFPVARFGIVCGILGAFLKQYRLFCSLCPLSNAAATRRAHSLIHSRAQYPIIHILITLSPAHSLTHSLTHLHIKIRGSRGGQGILSPDEPSMKWLRRSLRCRFPSPSPLHDGACDIIWLQKWRPWSDGAPPQPCASPPSRKSGNRL